MSNDFSSEKHTKANCSHIESKIKEPICIKLGHYQKEILADCRIRKNYPLDPGVMLGSIHYGFILISEDGSNQVEKTYPTQFKIDGISFESGILKIYEQGKYNPWRFDEKGNLLECSSFNLLSRKDLEFLKEQLKLLNNTNVEDIASFIK